MTELIWVDHLFAFALCVVAPVYAVIKGKANIDPKNMSFVIKKFIYRANSLFLWAIAAVALLIWYFLQRPWPALGLTWPHFVNQNHLVWAIIVAILFILAYSADVWFNTISYASRQKSRTHWLESAPFMPADWVEWRHFTILAFSAACTEEIIFRGYLVYYFALLLHQTTYSLVLSLLIPSLSFSLVHMYQGGKSVIKIFFFAMGFGVLYLLTQSLLWPVLIHLLVDLAGGYMTVKLFQETPENQG